MIQSVEEDLLEEVGDVLRAYFLKISRRLSRGFFRELVIILDVLDFVLALLWQGVAFWDSMKESFIQCVV